MLRVLRVLRALRAVSGARRAGAELEVLRLECRHLTTVTYNPVCLSSPAPILPGAVPCCRRSFPLAAFSVSGMQSVAARYNDTGA